MSDYSEIDKYRHRELAKLDPTYRPIPWGKLPAESRAVWVNRHNTGWDVTR